MEQSNESAYREVVGILAGGVNKGYIFKELVTEYPKVFLSIYNYDFHPVTFNKDIPPTPEPEIRYTDRVVETKVYPNTLPETLAKNYNDLPDWAQILVEFLKNTDKKILAIKDVRSRCGCGLKEAKDYVDTLIAHFVHSGW